MASPTYLPFQVVCKFVINHRNPSTAVPLTAGLGLELQGMEKEAFLYFHVHVVRKIQERNVKYDVREIPML